VAVVALVADCWSEMKTTLRFDLEMMVGGEEEEE
jgi:hypothetical protein